MVVGRGRVVQECWVGVIAGEYNIKSNIFPHNIIIFLLYAYLSHSIQLNTTVIAEVQCEQNNRNTTSSTAVPLSNDEVLLNMVHNQMQGFTEYYHTTMTSGQYFTISYILSLCCPLCVAIYRKLSYCRLVLKIYFILYVY